MVLEQEYGCKLCVGPCKARDEVRLRACSDSFCLCLCACLSIICLVVYPGFLLRCILWRSGFKRATLSRNWSRGCSSTASYSVLSYLYFWYLCISPYSIFLCFFYKALSLFLWHLRKDIHLKGLKWPGVRLLRCFLMIILLRCVNAVIFFPSHWTCYDAPSDPHWILLFGGPFLCCYSSIYRLNSSPRTKPPSTGVVLWLICVVDHIYQILPLWKLSSVWMWDSYFLSTSYNFFSYAHLVFFLPLSCVRCY